MILIVPLPIVPLTKCPLDLDHPNLPYQAKKYSERVGSHYYTNNNFSDKGLNYWKICAKTMLDRKTQITIMMYIYLQMKKEAEKDVVGLSHI